MFNTTDVENERVADVLAIQNVKAVYCQAADMLPTDSAAAASLLEQAFLPSARADYGNGILEGRDDIIDFLVNQVGIARDWVYHSIHTPCIAVEGETAAARWTISAYMKAKGSQIVEVAIGRYVDDLIRTPEGWRISYMRWIEEVRQ